MEPRRHREAGRDVLIRQIPCDALRNASKLSGCVHAYAAPCAVSCGVQRPYPIDEISGTVVGPVPVTRICAVPTSP
jgi:hypothetical protein